MTEKMMRLNQETAGKRHKPIVVAAMYKFLSLDNYKALRSPLLTLCREQDLKGTILLAREGINGTVAGSRAGIDALLAYLRSEPGLADLKHQESYHSAPPFYRMKLRLKQEIVSLGVPGVCPARMSGTKVDPAAWNALVQDPAVMVLDVRNQYEHEVGTFKNAISPQTARFREFPGYVRKNLHPDKHKKIAMFCTGGIRCEKASSYMLQQGFDEVYQLDGGILKYLEQVGEDESLWRGECFVFDGRVAVNERLEPGEHVQCFACRRPLSRAALSSEKYRQGISCPYCYEGLTEQRRQALAERGRQVELAAQRGYRHIGAPSKAGQA